MENFASREGVGRDRRRSYAAPARLAPNQWALTGEWTVGRQGALLNAPGGRIAFSFHARDLHLVMGPASGAASVRFRVTTARHPTRAARGSDIDEGGNGIASEPRLYQLVRQPKPISDELFEIEFLDPGVEVFAFTFG